MNTEKFLNIYFGNQSLIIEILFGVVFVGVSFLAFRYFLGKETAPTSDLTGIEESLKKLIESNIKAKRETKSTEDATSDTDQVSPSDEAVADLKTQIEEKQTRIAELEAQIASTPQGGGGGDSSALEEKIRDLESKLNEYSIIEDDIADLSFFKEETVRLQAEIDRLKGEIEKSATATPPTPSPATEPTPTPVTAEPEPTPTVEAPTAGESADFVGSDIMAEFQAAVEAQKASSVNTKAAKKIESIQAQKTASTELPPTETPTTEMPPSESLSPQDEIDRLLAASQAEPQPEAQASNSASVTSATLETKSEIDGPIDLDKMVSEAASLDPSVAVDITSIDGELNTDKLLSEASEMEKDTQVISEFNDFLEKENRSENKG